MDKSTRRFSSFDRDERIGKFEDRPMDEALLDQINLLLGPAEEQIEKSLGHARNYGSSLIVGMPRSGSTYLYQKVVNSLNVGYVSNLMARFYGNPLLGAWLQARLMRHEIQSLDVFESSHGVTARICEPHEFGYFWSHYLQFPGDSHQPKGVFLDRSKLASLGQKLANISAVFRRPVVYKCMIAPFLLSQILEETSVGIIYIRRRKEDVVASILKVREERLGSQEKWWSIRPDGWKEVMHLSPEDQVSWQYDKVVRAIEEARVKNPARFSVVDYSDLVRDADAVCRQIDYFVQKEIGDPI